MREDTRDLRREALQDLVTSRNVSVGGGGIGKFILYHSGEDVQFLWAGGLLTHLTCRGFVGWFFGFCLALLCS